MRKITEKLISRVKEIGDPMQKIDPSDYFE